MDNLPQIQDITKSKRVLVKDFNLEGIQIIEEDFNSNIQEGQFIAKVHAAPLNPLDLLKIFGKGSQIALPFTPGSECSGTVIHPESLRGQKVSFYVKDGSFRQYAVGSVQDVIFLPKDMDLSMAVSAYVNPQTCIGLFETAKVHNAKAVINTAANSQLGLMIYRYFSANGVEVINLVRGQSKVEEYVDKYNANYVLDIQSEKFDADLKNLATQLNATVCLDAYGGELSGRIFNSLPKNSYQYIYGSLISPTIDKINGVDIRWLKKELRGFVMMPWAAAQNKEFLSQARNNIVNGIKDVFSTHFTSEYSIENFQQAITHYQSNMSGGKIIIKM